MTLILVIGCLLDGPPDEVEVRRSKRRASSRCALVPNDERRRLGHFFLAVQASLCDEWGRPAGTPGGSTMSATAYDCIVVGSGQAGGPLAGAFAKQKKRTALIEKVHVGGTCINEGC